MERTKIKYPIHKCSFVKRDSRHLYKYFRKSGIKISISQVAYLYHNWSEIVYCASWLCYPNGRTLLNFYKSLKGNYSYANAYKTVYEGKNLKEPNFWEKWEEWNSIKDQSILED